MKIVILITAFVMIPITYQNKAVLKYKKWFHREKENVLPAPVSLT